MQIVKNTTILFDPIFPPYSGLRANEKKQSRLFLTASFLVWYHQESNRGHKDFQSFALPTELWHQHCFLFAVAKVRLFPETQAKSSKKVLPFNIR